MNPSLSSRQGWVHNLQSLVNENNDTNGFGIANIPPKSERFGIYDISEKIAVSEPFYHKFYPLIEVFTFLGVPV